MSIYFGNLGIETILGIVIYFIITTIFALFSPFGIGFIIFSIIRLNTDNETLKNISFIFQIIFTSLTFVIGCLASILVLFLVNPYRSISNFDITSILPSITVFFGVCFVVMIQIGVIFWVNSLLNNTTKRK